MKNGSIKRNYQKLKSIKKSMWEILKIFGVLVLSRRSCIIKIIPILFWFITKVFLLNLGWNEVYDEFICQNSIRLAPLGYFTNRNDIPKYANLFEDSRNMRSYIVTTNTFTDNPRSENEANENETNQNNQLTDSQNQSNSNPVLMPVPENTLPNENIENEQLERDSNQMLELTVSESPNYRHNNEAINILNYLRENENLYRGSIEQELLRRFDSSIRYFPGDVSQSPDEFRFNNPLPENETIIQRHNTPNENSEVYFNSSSQESTTRRNGPFVIERENIEDESQNINLLNLNINQNEVDSESNSQYQNSNSNLSKQK